MTSGLDQPAWPAAHQSPDQAEHAGRDQRHARQVEPGLGRVALRQQPQRQQAHGHPDRDVDPEDPVPVEAFGDRAADQRAQGHGQAREPAVDPDDRAAARGRERGGEDGQAQRQDRRAAQALHGPGRDQLGRAGRQRAGGGGQREQREPGDEDPAPAQPVAERGGGDDARGERDPVGVHRPLQGRQADLEAALHLRQRGDHYQRVQHHHEVGRRGQPEDPAEASAPRGGGRAAACPGPGRPRGDHIRIGRPRAAGRLRAGRSGAAALPVECRY